MKTFLTVAAAATIVFAGTAMAGDEERSDSSPVLLSATEMDQVTAGAGFMNKGDVWHILGEKLGFVPVSPDNHHGVTDQVIKPSRD